MADIAELGYKVDSSGLVEGTKALDDNAAAAEKTGNAAARLEKEYQSMSRTVDQSSKALGDRLGGALDRIGVGTGSVIAELQTLNRTQSEMLAALGGLDSRLTGTASALKAYESAGRQASAAVTSTATASQRLETDLAAQEARYRSVAREAVSYAESMRGANLSDRALAEAAREATSAYDSRAAVMARMGTEQERLAARAKGLQEAEARATNQARDAARATQAQELNLKKLLGQINPTVAALNRLADQEERLAKARDMGMLKPQVWQQYQAQLEAVRQKTLTAASGSDGLSSAFGRLNMQSAETQRNLSQLISYLATGNFGMAGSQVMQLGNQVGIAGRLFSGTGLAVGGFTAVIAAGLVAWKQGAESLFEFQKALILTGRGSEISGAQFQGMVNEIDRLPGVLRGQAIGALTAASGAAKIAGEQLELVAAAAARMEAAVGRSSSKTISAFESLAGDPVDALVTLNDAEGFLNRSQIDRILTLQQEGREQQATAEAVELYAKHLQDVADQADAAMPVLTRWWRDVKDEISGAWGELEVYAGLIDRVIQRQGQMRDMSFSGSMKQLAGNSGSLASLIPDGWLSNAGTLANALGKRVLSEAGGGGAAPSAFAVSTDGREDLRDYVELLREQEREEKAASEALSARLAGLDRESSKLLARNKIIEIYSKLEKNDARHFDGSMQRLISQSNSQIDKQFNRSGRTSDSGAERDAKALARAYESLNEQMAQQISLYGDKSRLSQTSYQIERGNLRGLKSDLAGVLLSQAAQLDAQERQKAASQDLTKLQADLNKEDRTGLALAQDRLKVLNEAKGEGVITEDDYNATLAKILSAGSQAPKVTGVDALYGGGAGELDKLGQQQKALEEWYAGQLVMLQTFRDSESSVNALYDQQALADRQAYVNGMNQIDRARQNVMLATAEQGFAAVTDVMRTSFSEQSALYKAAFVVQKAAAIAQATLAIQAGMAEAAKNPWPANLAAIASVAAATAGLISNIAAVGMAHDGIDSVPQDGTWLLQKGERVMTNQTSAKLDATLDRIAAGGATAAGGNGGNTYSPQIYINGDPDARTLQLVETAVRRGMTQTYDRVATEMATGQGRVAKGLRTGNTVQRRVR